MEVFFERRTELAPAIWEYYFIPERPVRYVPGQYISLHNPAAHEDIRGAARTLTLTSVPTDQEISVAARFETELSIYKQKLQALQPGDSLHIDDPMGDVILPKDASVPLIFVAGGLGIASFVSILNELDRTGEQRNISLFYRRQTVEDDPYHGLLEDFPFSQRYDFVKPKDLQAADILAGIAIDSLIYISGSETFVENLRRGLQAQGVSHEQIIFDFFDGYKEL